MRLYLILFLLTAACDSASKAKPSSSAEPEKTTESASARRSAAPSTAPMPSGAVAVAQDFTKRVCSCKDADCGQKVLDEAREKMPALAHTAAADVRATIDDERKKAFACMDTLVSSDPAEKSAIQASATFAAAVCACADAACVDKALREGKKAYDDGTSGPISKSGAGSLMVDRSKMTKCLETLRYKGSTVPDIGKVADAMADKVCACKDTACTEGELRAGGKVFAMAFTPDDMNIVRGASKRASECVGKLQK